MQNERNGYDLLATEHLFFILLLQKTTKNYKNIHWASRQVEQHFFLSRRQNEFETGVKLDQIVMQN